MMWVIRAGKDSLFYEKYLDNGKVYIPWDGYQLDLSKFTIKPEYRKIVEKEKRTTNRTTVSNWAGQLFIFVHEIKIGDIILIPSKRSRSYCVGKITGGYVYDEYEPDSLYHAREFKLLLKEIPRELFSQEVIYSLGAFRTIFKATHEDEILRTIKKWKEKKG